jgi:hypothetical protein
MNCALRFRGFSSVLFSVLILVCSLNTLVFAGEFQISAVYPAGGCPFFVRAADLNGDGILDLVTADDCSDSVFVLLGEGKGKFQAAVSYAASGTMLDLAVADFNGDGIPDVAASYRYNVSIYVAVFLGQGDGSLGPPAVALASSENGSGHLAAGDFNRDGKYDVAVTANTTVSILLGNGDGTFGDPSSLQLGAYAGSTGIVTGDLNQDNTEDFIVLVGGTSVIQDEVAVFLGNGDGSFQPPVNYSTSILLPTGAALGDLNGDGNADLVVAGNNPYGAQTQGVSLLLGNGDGTLAAPQVVESSSPAISAAVADFNGDGTADIAFTIPSTLGNTVGVMLGKGDASFLSPALYFAEYTFVAGITPGDFNGDGYPDLAIGALGGMVGLMSNVDHLPAAALSVTGLRFGGQKVGTTSNPVAVTLANSGYNALAISAITVTGDFLAKNDCGSSVAIGDSCTITVQFRPRSLGLKTGKITITDNAKPPAHVIHPRGVGIQ